MAIVHTLKQGMTEALQMTLQDKNGNPVNLTGSTLVFHMQDGDGTQVIDGQSVTVTAAASGQVEYAWGAGETDTVGEYEAEVHETTVGGKVVIYPSTEYLIIVILEDRKT